MSLTQPELLILAGCCILFLAYHAYFLWEIGRRTEKTAIGQAKKWRRAWIERMVARQDNIVVVQAFRNWIMSATFISSTSLLIGAGLLGFLASADQVSHLIHELNFLGMRTSSAFSMKILILIGNFGMSFFNFALAIRFYNYAVLRATGSALDDALAVPDAARYMEKGAMHYALGMRCYYFAIPLVLWLFGPIWLGIGAVVMVVALYRHDHPFSGKV